VDVALINLGRERYDIHCSRCHGESGNGAGVLSKYGIANIFNFHQPAFTSPTDAAYRSNGQVFDVITKGKGLMGPYGANTTVKERWAIIAWLRTMAMARSAPVSDPAVKAVWDAVKPPDAAKPAAATPVAAN
jgi:mono/diheme cytochrome c family protein